MLKNSIVFQTLLEGVTKHVLLIIIHIKLLQVSIFIKYVELILFISFSKKHSDFKVQTESFTLLLLDLLLNFFPFTN